MYNWPTKLTAEVLDYQIDWSERLSRETIITSLFSVVQGDVIVASSTHANNTATVWLSGGTTSCVVRNVITTSDERTMQMDVSITVKSS